MKKQVFAAFTAFLMALLITSTGCDGSKKGQTRGLFFGTEDTGDTTGGDTGTGDTGTGDTGTGDTGTGDTGTGDTGTGDTGTGDTGTGDTGSDDTGTIDEATLRLVFAGDVMMARKVKTSVDDNGGGNYGFCFQYVADYLRSADFAFVNLESIISNTGIADPTQLLQGIAFRAVPEAMDGLTFAGIDAVSVANNHAFDYGRIGFDDCVSRLKGAGIAPIGGGSFEEAYSAKIFDVQGTKVALLGFTLVGDETSIRAQQTDGGLIAQTGVAWFYSKYANPAINAARRNADIVVVSFHFGAEYATLPNAVQDRFAHQCIDQGAHLVIGHHPHVVQPVMAYAKGYIACSLGNFIFDQSDPATQRGMILEVLVRDKKIYRVSRKYIQINNLYQPVMQ